MEGRSRGAIRRHNVVLSFLSVVILMVCVSTGYAVEHNLPEGVELVDPKDLGLDSQFDLDKLLGNVKALPIDTNALSSALGKPGLKTQVLTVGFDGSEGLNLDDFELPHLKNDEHAPLAQEAFKSFKNFFRNTSMATQVGDDEQQQQQPQHRAAAAPASVSRNPTQFSKQIHGQRQAANGGGGSPGKRLRTTMKRRKVVRVNGTTTTTPPPPPQEQSSADVPAPKVIELDSSQIEKLIASGKIGPPKSLTPGGPQVIELGQRDLDALLNGDNGDEIKQILEGGDTLQNFDLSQLTGANAPVQVPQDSVPQQQQQRQQQYTESTDDPLATSQYPTHGPPQATQTFATATTEESTQPPPQQSTTTTQQPPSISSVDVDQTQTPTPTSTTTTNHPIIYQYNSAQDQKSNIPPQGIQGAIPLQFYSSHANGQQQARLVKTPTFEFISAPPVSFSSSVLSHQNTNNNNQQQIQQFQQQQQQQQVQQQQPPQTLFIQPQPQFQHQFIALSQPQIQQQQNIFQEQQQSHFIPAQPPPQQPIISNSAPPPKPVKNNKESFLNKIVPAAHTSHHTEQVKFQSKPTSSPPQPQAPPQNNYISQLHKVNLPLNSVKLVTPSPQAVQSVLNQVPDSFQPSIIANHVVSSPVLDPLRVGTPVVGGIQTSFLRGAASLPAPASPLQQQQQQQPFRNNHLFNSLSGPEQPRNLIRTHPSAFIRFPSASTSSSSTSSILSSTNSQAPAASPSSGSNRFRVAESQNPFFTFRPQGAGGGGFGSLILNSFVAGDGLNYRARSREDFHSPGI